MRWQTPVAARRSWRGSLASIMALALGMSALTVALASPSHAATHSYTTPGAHTFTVPAGVVSLRVTAVGGGGGGGVNSAGGHGARVEATISVTAGDELAIYVGGGGGDGQYSGGGGGASTVGAVSSDQIVAGGGGGGGHDGGSGGSGGLADGYGGSGGVAGGGGGSLGGLGGFGGPTGPTGYEGTGGGAGGTGNGGAGGVAGDWGANGRGAGGSGSGGGYGGYGNVAENGLAFGGGGGGGAGGGGGGGVYLSSPAIQGGGGGAGGSQGPAGVTYATASNGGTAGHAGGDGSVTITYYTLTYDGNGNTGGTAPASQSGYEAEVTVASAGSLVKSGSTFDGWNTVADGTGTDYNPGGTFTVSSNATLFAQWVALPERTVTFDANGGSGSMLAQTSNVPTALTANGLTRSGYTFAGWNTQADGGGTSYADGATYAFDADDTLYAQWHEVLDAPPPPATYTFSFNTPTGGRCFDWRVTDGTEVMLPGSNVSCVPGGATLVGWSIPGQDYAFAPGAGVRVTAPQTFTAVALTQTLEVTYDANVGFVAPDSVELAPCLASGGVNIHTSPDAASITETVARYGALATSPVCAPPGWTFKGWTNRPTVDGPGQAVAGASVFNGGASVPALWNDGATAINRIHLYALWGEGGE